MVKEKTLLLNKEQTKQKIRRIAYEIYEDNFQEKEIVIAGIFDRGYSFAKLLIKELKKISAQEIILLKVTLDKVAPLQSEITFDKDLKIIQNKTVILTDDVQNTGRTLAYSLKPFLNIEIKKLQTAVIVDRNHKNFPISVDYVGYELSTTLQEHITVISEDKEEFGVYIH